MTFCCDGGIIPVMLTHKFNRPLLLGLCVLLMGCRFLVNFFSFFPDRQDLLSPESLPPGVEERFIDTADGERLQCYWISRPRSRHLLIYFHGNAGNIGHRLPDLGILADMNINVLGVGYRGYGRSSGRPSEAGIYADGRAALEYAGRILGFGPEAIVLFGRSIGSTVAVNTAMDTAVAAVILVSPMTSGKAMGRQGGFGPLAFLAGDAFDNLSKIKRLSSPLLIVHGTADEIIPFAMGRKLHAAAPEPKTFAPIAGAGHNDISIATAGAYWEAVARFLSTLSISSTL